MAVKARLDIIDGFLRSIEVDPANLRVGFLDDCDLAPALKNLHREHGAHHAWHAVWQTVCRSGRERLSLCVGFTGRLNCCLPLLVILGPERWGRSLRWY